MVHGILAIVSHPDDETFGCGGTLALHASMGNSVTVLCLSCNPPERKQEILNATKALGVTDTIVLENNDVKVDSVLIKKVSSIIVNRKPRVVITHLEFDYHRDHRATYELVKEAVEWTAHTTTYDDAWVVEKLLLMEVNTMIPVPHIIMDITSTIDKKRKAIEAYPSQLAKFPWGYYQKQNLKKAEFRGVQGNCDYAEAFLIEPIAQNGPFYPRKSSTSLL